MTLPVSGDRSLGNLYFRSADRLRAAGCATALAREGLSVVMQCGREALLDHYSDMVLAELAKVHGDVRIEAYFPESTESLMARFNEILARHTVQDALKPGVVDTPLRVWVVHDAARVPGAEIQLLARLIHNFPGANVRALLLVPQADAEAASSSAFAAFGRRLLRWDIELPTSAQVEAALESARYENREMAVRQLLRLSGLLPSSTATPESNAGAAPLTTVKAASEADTAGDEVPATRPRAAVTRPLAWVKGVQGPIASAWTALAHTRTRVSAKAASGRAATPGSAHASKTPAPRFSLRKPSDKTQGAIAVAGALLAISTLAMYWLQPDAFAGKSAKAAATPATQAAASQQALPASAATSASITGPATVQTVAQAPQATANAPAPSRFGQGVSPLWRAREATAAAKMQ